MPPVGLVANHLTLHRVRRFTSSLLVRNRVAGSGQKSYTPNNPFNDACLRLLPPRPIPIVEGEAVGFVPICVFFPAAVYVEFTSGPTLPIGSPWYLDANCSVLAFGLIPFPMAYASDGIQALALCQSNFSLNNVATTGNPNLFICQS